MPAFTYIAPDASIVIAHRDDGTKVLQVHAQHTPLTKEHLRALAYYCALYYRDIAHADPFTPGQVVINLPPAFKLPDLL